MGLTERLDAVVNRTEALADRLGRALDQAEGDFYPFSGQMVERQEGVQAGDYRYKVHQASWWPQSNHVRHASDDSCPSVTPTGWRAYLDAVRHDKEHGCQERSSQPPYTECGVSNDYWRHVPDELVPVPMAAPASSFSLVK